MQRVEQSSSRHRRVVGGIVWVFVLGLLACQTAPITGRQQIMLVSSDEENRLGIEAYEKILQEEKVSHDPQLNALVQRVGARIAAVVNRPDFAWEFHVIDKDAANAFALPGGKVAVYTGILQYTQTETGLAVVLGHEVAHALARHGGERMSRSMIAQLGLTAVQTGLNTNNPTIVQGIALAYGVGVELPFDRGQESEADHIGLILMAKAGYDPRQAIPFWEQMSSANQSKGAPEFLSTHPSGDTRIKQLRQWMPEALQYYSGRRS
jgi:predicted Zn-dependent protease